eukprot:TRINITY_DN48418_c0_g1_i1.p1 TRINITY_DN48418_c0_g1~~TRINITY_DN48418_c0_g1_i1.p1  ORF type:complete len:332 (-),score=48.57 TRINITY_DN48418_c0_g1_i1:64-1059(-)
MISCCLGCESRPQRRLSDIFQRQESESNCSWHTALSQADALELADDDLTRLQQLRNAVKSQRASSVALLGDRWFEDGDLLRYVRAKAKNSESEDLFCKMIAWRLEKAKLWGKELVTDGSFGSCHAAYLKGDKESAPAWWRFLHRNLPICTYGADKHGLPVLYNAMGKADLHGCAREVGQENVTRFAVYQNDYFFDIARSMSSRNEAAQDFSHVLHSGVTIVDMDGFSVRRFYSNFPVFKHFAEAAKFLHPERQRRCFIVRAPWVFASIWNVVSAVLDPKTVSRISILGVNDSLQPLIDEVGAGNVPYFLGGTFRDLPDTSGQAIAVGAFVQ